MNMNDKVNQETLRMGVVALAIIGATLVVNALSPAWTIPTLWLGLSMGFATMLGRFSARRPEMVPHENPRFDDAAPLGASEPVDYSMVRPASHSPIPHQRAS